MLTRILLTAVGLALSAPAGAARVYFNNFDTENGGQGARDYTGFDGLEVQYPVVDLIRTGDDSGVTCAGGSGGCVDLDGGLSGKLRSARYAFAAGDLVTWSFSASGSQRASSPLDAAWYFFEFDQLTTGSFAFTSTFGTDERGEFVADDPSGGGDYRLGLQVAAPFDLGFHDVAFSFVAANAGTFRFSFDDYTPDTRVPEFGVAPDFDDDDAGRVIDNVALDIAAVPEPSSWAAMIAGFSVVGGTLRRRRPGVRLALAR